MKYFGILFFLLVLHISGAQNTPEVDSLLNVLNNDLNDSAKIDTWNELVRVYSYFDSAKTSQYAIQVIELAEKIGYPEARCKALINQAWNYLDFQHFQAADSVFKVALQLARNDNLLVQQVAALQGLGQLNFNQANYSEAIQYQRLALDIRIKQNDSSGIASRFVELAYLTFAQGEYEESKTYNKEAVKIYESLGDSLRLANCYNQFGNIYSKTSKFDSALHAINLAINILRKIGQEKELASVLSNLAIIHSKMGDMDKALTNYLQALELDIKYNKTLSAAYVMINMGILYKKIQDYEKARLYYDSALTIVSKEQDLAAITSVYANLGVLSIEKNDFNEALHYLFKADSVRKIMDTRDFKAEIYKNLGHCYLEKGKLQTARQYLNEALESSEKVQSTETKSEILVLLGKAAYTENNYSEAVSYLLRGIELGQELKYFNPIRDGSKVLSEVYGRQGNYQSAFKYHKLFKTFEDSLISENNTRKLARLEAEFAVKERQDSIQFANQNMQLAFEAELKQNRIIQTSVAIALILVIILLVIVYRFYQVKKRANEDLLELNEEINAQKEEIVVQNEEITKQKTSLEQLNAELKELNKEKNKLIAVVAHDLRSPLNQIKGLIHLYKLESDCDEKEESRYLNQALEATDRLTDMVKRILDVSAIESKRIDLRLEKIPIAPMLEQLVTNFTAVASAKNQTILKDFEAADAVIEADRNYLFQVLENIISNAIKFSEKGKTIRLNLHSTSDVTRISVEDEGPGISPEDQKKLFNEFSQLSAKPTAGEKSTGLGLSIAKKYVEAMKGTIRCESKLGVGSKFYVEFPTSD